MKKVVSLISAIAVFAAVSGAAIAEGNNPEVYVNNAKIYFEDQEAVIVDNRTLVPARGVFESMGANVDWDGEERLVTIATGDNTTLIKLTIDDSNMRVYDMAGMFANFTPEGLKAPETVVELDVAPQIINDRTMIPLRAISEAIGADVKWLAEDYKVDITTKNAPSEEKAATLPTYSLTASADTVAEGETVDIFVNLKNLPENMFVSSVTALVEYNNDSFEFVSSALMDGDTVVENAVGVDNTELADNQVKIVHVTIDGETAAKNDGVVAKLTFKSKNGGEGSFALKNSYRPLTGFDTTLLITSTDEETLVEEMYDDTKLNIDFTPVVVNGEAAPEASAEPEATEAPAETAEPETTAAPETSAEPQASAEPEASAAPAETAEPETTEAPEASAEPTAEPAK